MLLYMYLENTTFFNIESQKSYLYIRVRKKSTKYMIIDNTHEIITLLHFH